MDIVFETADGRRFEQEIWFFSSVLEIKEKLQKYHGFPVSRQTLVFKGKVMEDQRDAEYYEIIQGSRILLRLEPERGSDDPPISTLVTVRIPLYKAQFNFSIEAAAESAARLKERVQERFYRETGERLPTSHMALLHGGGELQDSRMLEECGVGGGSEFEVVMRPFVMAAAGGGNAGKRVKVSVLLPAGPGTRRMQLEVNLADNVSELRKELERLREIHRFQLPPEGFFFIFKQNVMDEDRTFRWHDVRSGEIIEIFNGSVSGGRS